MGKFSRIQRLGAKVRGRLRSRSASTPKVKIPDIPAAEPVPNRLEPQPGTPPTGTRALDARGIQAVIEKMDGPVLINHWATWCEGCVAELPSLIKLHQGFGDSVTFLGVSWEGFQFERPDAVAHVIQFGAQHGVSWDSLLVDDRPDQLFDALKMSCQTIPQICLLDATGAEVFRCEDVLDEEGFSRLSTALKELSDGA
jgi:thiol-disulfide isomerase/thioredoxin